MSFLMILETSIFESKHWLCFFYCLCTLSSILDFYGVFWELSCCKRWKFLKSFARMICFFSFKRISLFSKSFSTKGTMLLYFCTIEGSSREAKLAMLYCLASQVYKVESRGLSSESCCMVKTDVALIAPEDCLCIYDCLLGIFV